MMTKNAALFELCEIAQTVLLRSSAKDGPTELFTYAEAIKDECLVNEPDLSGSGFSKEYKEVEEYLRK